MNTLFLMVFGGTIANHIHGFANMNSDGLAGHVRLQVLAMHHFDTVPGPWTLARRDSQAIQISSLIVLPTFKDVTSSLFWEL